MLRGVVIERNRAEGGPDPVAQMVDALEHDDSLILFPEGTRNTTDATLLPFRSGIWRVATARPDVECVPVWIENLNRVMPKGEFLPIPLLCTLTFGAPLRIARRRGQGRVPRADPQRVARARAAAGMSTRLLSFPRGWNPASLQDKDSGPRSATMRGAAKW